MKYFFLFLSADSVLSTTKQKAPVLRGFQNKYYHFVLEFGPIPISSQTVIVLNIMTYCAHFPLRKMTDDDAYEEFQLSYTGRCTCTGCRDTCPLGNKHSFSIFQCRVACVNNLTFAGNIHVYKTHQEIIRNS